MSAIGPRLRAAERHAEFLVRLAVDGAVRRLRIAEPVVPDGLRPPVLVGVGVEEALGVRRPDQAVAPVLDQVGKLRAGFEIAHLQNEAFGAVGVDRIGEQAAVRADGVAAEPEIFVAFRERRFVEDDGIGAAARRPPVPLAIFRAGIEGVPIDECAVLLRHAGVVVLHPAFHLGEQRVDEPSMRLHRRFEIGVLRVEIAEHVRVVDLRIGGIAKPGVRVFDGDAMMRDAVRHAPRDWGCPEDRLAWAVDRMRECVRHHTGRAREVETL